MSFLNSLLTSLRGIASSKLRAALTTLGIVIGVASVIVMLALGNGARAAVEANFRYLGSDEVQIFERKGIDNGELKSLGKPLTFEDGLLMTDAVPDVQRVDMTVSGAAHLRYQRNAVDVSFMGVTADALSSMIASGQVQPANWPPGKAPLPQDFIGQGRFFTPAEALDGTAVCILPYTTAQDLFEGDDAIDETISVNRFHCTVIGVLVELEPTDPNDRFSNSQNEGIILPISAAVSNLFDEEPSVDIQAYVKDESRIDQIKGEIADYLRQRHGIPTGTGDKSGDDFDMTTRSDILGAQQEAARTFSTLLAAMAIVSLAVGGIGIMNVMLVSVTERTREIGIRLAVGAKQADIILQFLLESVLISAAGGVFGIALGVLAIPLAASFNQGAALLSPGSIPLAFGVALITGVVFGLYPAVRAAGLNPIDALRYE